MVAKLCSRIQMQLGGLKSRDIGCGGEVSNSQAHTTLNYKWQSGGRSAGTSWHNQQPDNNDNTKVLIV
jgi:hypothetical protein